ncbi:hypothetical protein E1A91_A09G135900v1 [Gossypium mustelinum]|uniref:3,9-dihydroxypterocarpan 6A-monooxygenase n=1 Tax=Gossypium mustelinum TaxID=34275 RepID=A0A5D2XXE6_GOSMU|nr:hypothetical protein E1A91_A09G135900v1 [Gossypium mustelinum]
MAPTLVLTDFLLLIISTLLLVLLVKSLRNSKSKGKYPPSAPALPIIGHIHLLKSGLPTSFATLARKYGPLMQIRLGAAKFVVVSDAKSAQEILRTFDTDFASKFQPGPTNYHIYEDSSFANAPYGAYWKFMKKLFMTKLLTGSQLQRFTNIGEQETIKLIKSLLNRSKAGEPCDLTAELTEVTHSTIYKMAIGRRYSNNPSQAAEIRKIITYNCENDDEKDVMDILLETYKDADAEVKLTRDQIKNFFMAMEELINHPNIFKILREEIDSIVGNNRLIKESDVPKLPYLQAVAKEILRLHPPSPFLRRLSNKDSKINGFDIQKGTRVFINVYMLMRDPNCYKEPEKFMPERFLGNCTEMKGRDFHYLPFGRGRRGCPGASLAKSLLHATIGALVQCFDWKVKDGEKADTEATGTGYSGAFASPLPCYPITRFDPFQE